MKTSKSPSTTRNWNVDVLLHKQLQQGIGQLRITHAGSHRNIIGQVLGHFDNLLGIRHERIEEVHDVRQLFHHLRRRIIESRQRKDSIDSLLHGAPQNPLLRPGQGRNPLRPRPAELLFVKAEEAEELRLGSGGGGGGGEGSRMVAVKFISRPSSLALATIGRCALWCVNAARARALDDEELFVVEGSQKIHSRNGQTAENVLQV